MGTDTTRNDMPNLWTSDGWSSAKTGMGCWQHSISDLAVTIADAIGALSTIAPFEDAEPFDAARTALELGAVLGFAIRDTWPANLEEMTAWPTRALARADLDSWPWMKEYLAERSADG